jgi:phosphotransacetylase
LSGNSHLKKTKKERIMLKKNVIAAEKPKSKKQLPKGLQTDVMTRLQGKGLTAKMCQEIIQSKDNYLAEAMVKALEKALMEVPAREAS